MGAEEPTGPCNNNIFIRTTWCIIKNNDYVHKTESSDISSLLGKQDVLLFLISHNTSLINDTLFKSFAFLGDIVKITLRHIVEGLGIQFELCRYVYMYI